MHESEIKELFRRFATPLAGFVALGGRKESVEELARNLWLAMLVGDEAEERMWQALAATDTELCAAVKRCYLEDMKPSVSKEELLALRQRYQPADDNG
jgi:hypothetical protein